MPFCNGGLRIYFADLTHSTVGLATEVFPLNVGFVAAYCRKQYGPSVNARIFKYIHDLEEAIEKDPPDLLALSNYPWCHRIGLALANLLAERRAEALCVMGGPNFPHDAASQRRFLQNCPRIDAYVYLDGEVGFANLVRVVLDAHSLQEAREQLKVEAVPGCVQRNPAGDLLAAPVPVRLRDLDEIPSPYLMGLLDPFFDGRLSPMIQTNRGCPFRCTFCHDGVDLVDRVNSFSVERVKAEICYIAERVPRNTHNLFISDLNFGMYKRDAEISEALARARRESGYPSYIDCTTGKNSKQRVINAIEQLDGALALTMSVQSMTGEVLKNIKRDNIRVADFLALQPAIRKAKLPTVSEVILGLPGETLASHVRTLSDLLETDVDVVNSYTLMMIHGAEMSTPEQRARWGFETKYRVIPRDFTRLRSHRNVVEIEEVAVASKTISFDEYLEARKLAFIVESINNSGFRALLRYLRHHGITAMALVQRLLAEANAASHGMATWNAFTGLVREFERDTRGELWDSAEELEVFFADDRNFQGLIEGRYGKNLLQSYHARLLATAMPEFSVAVFRQARELMALRAPGEGAWFEFNEIERFCRSRSHNLLGPTRLTDVPAETLRHDIMTWLADTNGQPLAALAFDRGRLFHFIITNEQFRLLEDALDVFGHTPEGQAKALIRLTPNALWRTPVPATPA